MAAAEDDERRDSSPPAKRRRGQAELLVERRLAEEGGSVSVGAAGTGGRAASAPARRVTSTPPFAPALVLGALGAADVPGIAEAPGFPSPVVLKLRDALLMLLCQLAVLREG
ncbi:unnamed protein product [Prorocentrum cordatum]|uniref:Uncharacterized protein n=1 Tax=Prorocentrum cordatum TaxID=2364126 RepID=A0ABN9QRX8_9DINO|nr:unnamed protein product [Polarella glacialis]